MHSRQIILSQKLHFAMPDDRLQATQIAPVVWRGCVSGLLLKKLRIDAKSWLEMFRRDDDWLVHLTSSRNYKRKAIIRIFLKVSLKIKPDELDEEDSIRSFWLSVSEVAFSERQGFLARGSMPSHFRLLVILVMFRSEASFYALKSWIFQKAREGYQEERELARKIRKKREGESCKFQPLQSKPAQGT